MLREKVEAARPAVWLSTLPYTASAPGVMPLEASMLHLDSGPCRAFEHETDFDFAGMLGIGGELVLAIQMLCQDEPGGWLEGRNATGVTLRTVRADLIPASTDLRLDNEVGHRLLPLARTGSCAIELYGDPVGHRWNRIELRNWLSLAALIFLPLIGFINRNHVEEAALSATLAAAYTNYACG